MSAHLAWRLATQHDAAELAAMNLRLIRDEGHRNPMTLAELEKRMSDWIVSEEYRAVLFSRGEESIGYALYREDSCEVYLRQFFIKEECRRNGFGGTAINLLRSQVFPEAQRVVIEVLCGNHSGQQFWKAVGFKDYAVTMELLS